MPALRAPARRGGLTTKPCVTSVTRPVRLVRPGVAAPQPIGRPAPRFSSVNPPRAAGNDDASSDLLTTLKSITRTPAYRGPLQIAVFLIVFMVFDAAFSGDWSRIGAISKDTEAALKPVAGAIAVVHVISAGVAWQAVAGRGGQPLVPAAKALAVGFLAAVEAVWAEE